MAADLHLTLTRTRRARQTLGMLRLHQDGHCVMTCVTSELPWRGNERKRSCIPPGPEADARTYTVQPHVSPTFGRCLWVRGVPGRSEILIHAGNYVSDTLGCILVGRTYTDLDGDGLTDITHSRDTLEALVSHVTAPTVMDIQWAERHANLAPAA